MAHSRPFTLLVQLTTILALCKFAYAGDINQPTHLPNETINKINQVRLFGLVAEEEQKGEISDQLGRFGVHRIEQVGCNVNIGNSLSPIVGGDRDVIINGDVINYCDQ